MKIKKIFFVVALLALTGVLFSEKNYAMGEQVCGYDESGELVCTEDNSDGAWTSGGDGLGDGTTNSNTNSTDSCSSCLNACESAYAGNTGETQTCQTNCAPQCGGDVQNDSGGISVPKAGLGDPCDPSIDNYCGAGLACVTADMDEVYYYCADASGGGYTVSGSQCKSGQDGGKQTGCANDNDADILKNQCEPVFGTINCQSMQEYLNNMQMWCEAEKPAGIDCKMISQGGYYGREAAKMAQYLASKSKIGDSSTGKLPLEPGKNKKEEVRPAGLYWPGPEIGLPAPPGGIQQILKNLLTWLLGIVGVVALIGFVISGIQYITAGGSEDRMETAKKNMLYSIIGITVVLASFVIIQAINYALEARSLF